MISKEQNSGWRNMKIFNKNEGYTNPRADMFLPLWLNLFGIFLDICAIAAAILSFVLNQWAFLVLTAILLPIGIAAFLCWRNQKIVVIDSGRFEYTTFLGKTTTYYFSDIKSLTVNGDSMTLFVGDGKVHIESIAIISDWLVNRIDEELSKNIFDDARL